MNPRRIVVRETNKNANYHYTIPLEHRQEGDLVYTLTGVLKKNKILTKPTVEIGTTWKSRAGGRGLESVRTVVAFMPCVPGLTGPRAVVTEEYYDNTQPNPNVAQALIMTVESIRQQLPWIESGTEELVEVPVE